MFTNHSAIAIAVQLAFAATTSTVAFQASAEEQQQQEADNSKLEVIQVTARKRVENAQEVPVAITALQGEALETLSSAAMDIRFLNARTPSLTVESSFGRTFPRFYMRGLGNSDFDLNASQPVSLVVDDIVQENPILKGFPVFDVERVETLRGPQGTLFGRNTPAGLVKFDSVKPSQAFDAFASASYGSHNTSDIRAAVGGGLTDSLSARVSVLHQDRDDYIDTIAPGFEKKDVLGGYTDKAIRLQLLWEADDFSALLNYHKRDLDGKPVAFYGNGIKKGSNKLGGEGWEGRDKVFHDSADRATQEVEIEGYNLKLEWDLGDHTITSISGVEKAELFSRADVDGGYGSSFAAGCCDIPMGPGVIALDSETSDAIPDHDQLTQELRLASNFNGPLNYQVGVFYFDEDLEIESISYDPVFSEGDLTGRVKQWQETTAWAVFGSVDYDFTERLSVTAGLRYSDDDKDYRNERFKSPLAFLGAPDQVTGEVNPSDTHVSWDLSATYKYNDDVNFYGRIADSFRAPSIQGRNLFAFDDGISVADSETILSFEAGTKANILDGQGRLNAAVFYFTMDDQQLTSVGGDSNTARLLNADETQGYGFEVDAELIVTDNLLVTFGTSYNNTELKDSSLSVPVCANCTVTDPVIVDPDGSSRALIDGNSLPHAPEWIHTFTARWSQDLGDGEVFLYTDWSYRSEINFFLYEAKEFEGESLLEGGARGGYAWEDDGREYEAAVFVRNMTDEQQAIGAVDFTNNAAIVNEERFIGAEFKVNFF
ncbi:TonB-dependent receptor [Neiella marina]|uniref:TonB-dependent receptor n=1 Tax=Neiella marina TaxID=508461 RepID=A0A8J2U4N5_9GAMM|nr:TonB-dependent receptor [Neiella marina]GGA75202.1 TonB-dependent receptor [Neiella marina]